MRRDVLKEAVVTACMERSIETPLTAPAARSMSVRERSCKDLLAPLDQANKNHSRSTRKPHRGKTAEKVRNELPVPDLTARADAHGPHPQLRIARVCSVRYVPRHTAGIYRQYYRYRTLR